MARLTSKIALDLVLRIEALQGQIEDVYAEARGYDGENNDNVIRDAVDARSAQRENAGDAQSLIASFDWDGEGNPLEPEAEPAWPVISGQLREAAVGNRKLLAMVDQIDKLHALSLAQGLPQPTLAELNAELERAGISS